MIIIDIDNVPKSCDVCPFMLTNDDLMSDDYRYRYCGFPYMGEYVSDYIASRHPNCPLKCDIEGIKAEMESAKYLKYGQLCGATNCLASGLDKAIEIINKHIGERNE